MHHQVSVNHARLLQLVGDDATHEMGLCRAQRGHQVVQLLPVRRRHSGEATTLLATASLAASITTGRRRLARMVGEDLHQQFVGGLLQLIDDGVVEGVLVLLQPTGDVVRHATGVMGNGEVAGRVAGLRDSRLTEWRRLAQMVGRQLLSERLIGGLGEHRLLFQDGQDTHGLCGCVVVDILLRISSLFAVMWSCAFSI